MPPPTRISQVLEKLELIAKNTGELLTEGLDRVAKNTHRPALWMVIEIIAAGFVASLFGYGWIWYSDTRKEWAEDEKIFARLRQRPMPTVSSLMATSQQSV